LSNRCLTLNQNQKTEITLQTFFLLNKFVFCYCPIDPLFIMNNKWSAFLPSTPQTCQIPQKKTQLVQDQMSIYYSTQKKVIMINQRNFLSTNPKTKCVCRPGLPSQSIKNGDLFFVRYQSIFKLKTPKTRN